MGDTQTLLALDGGDGQRWAEGYGPHGILRRVTYTLELSFEALAPPSRCT